MLISLLFGLTVQLIGSIGNVSTIEMEDFAPIKKVSRAKRSAFVPIFSVLYFDLKRKGAKLHELTNENRNMISRLSHIVANNTFMMADMNGKLHEIYMDSPHGRAFGGFQRDFIDQSIMIRRAVMSSDDRYQRIFDDGRDLELNAMGQSIPINFLTKPSLAFAAGCAFNLLTVLLCFVVAFRYCRTKRRQAIRSLLDGSSKAGHLTVNINGEETAETVFSKSQPKLKGSKSASRDLLSKYSKDAYTPKQDRVTYSKSVSRDLLARFDVDERSINSEPIYENYASPSINMIRTNSYRV